MSNQNPGGRPAPLTPKVADRLLELLASDDQFRDLFARDPAAALIQAGHQANADDLATLKRQLKVRQLAPKEAIAAARDEIRASLTSALAMQPIQLDTGAAD